MNATGPYLGVLSDRSVLDEQLRLTNQQRSVSTQDQIQPARTKDHTAAHRTGVIADIKDVGKDVGGRYLNQSRTVQFAPEPIANRSGVDLKSSRNLTTRPATRRIVLQ